MGQDRVRVPAALGHLPDCDVGALEQPPPGVAPEVQVTASSAHLVNVELTVEVATPAVEAEVTPPPQVGSSVRRPGRSCSPRSRRTSGGPSARSEPDVLVAPPVLER
jgi:hypothetical protein